MRKIFMLALFIAFGFHAEAQINNLTIEDVKHHTNKFGEFIEQDMNLLKEHVDNAPQTVLLESRNLLRMKYEKLASLNGNEPKEKVEAFCHSLTERFRSLLGEEFPKVAEDPAVIRQLSGLSLFVKQQNQN